MNALIGKLTGLELFTLCFVAMLCATVVIVEGLQAVARAVTHHARQPNARPADPMGDLPDPPMDDLPGPGEKP